MKQNNNNNPLRGLSPWIDDSSKIVNSNTNQLNQFKPKNLTMSDFYSKAMKDKCDIKIGSGRQS